MLNGNSPYRLLGLYGGPRTRPPRRTHAASLRAPRSTFAAAPDPRAGLSRGGRSRRVVQAPRRPLRTPGPPGRARGVPGATRGGGPCPGRLTEKWYKNLVPLFEVGRAKTSRAPFQALRGAIDAPRVGAFGKPAGGVVRGLSRLPPLKKCRPKEAILPFSDVSSGPARLGVPGGHPRPGSDSFSVVFAPFGALFPPLDPTRTLPWIYTA